MGETSRGSVKNHQKENQDNDSKASSDKKAKKTEKLAALDKEFNTKMRLRKFEFEKKQKLLEMELHRLKKKVRSNCNTKRKHLMPEILVLMMVPHRV